MSEPKKISLELPDGSRREYTAGVTGREVAESIGKRLAADALAIKLDDEIQDLARPIGRDAKIKIITPRTRDGKLDPDALHVLRHSAAHVMAEAICKLWPETKLVYGPPVEDGFYYDIELAHKISADEFAKIENEMRKVVAAKAPFTRVEMPREEGLKKVSAEGNPYKLDNAQRADGALSFYVTGTPSPIHAGAPATFQIMELGSIRSHTRTANPYLCDRALDELAAAAEERIRHAVPDLEKSAHWNAYIVLNCFDTLIPNQLSHAERDALIAMANPGQLSRSVHLIHLGPIQTKMREWAKLHWPPFQDLCRGPHVPDTGRIGAFKVTSIAGAYWHGDATKQQLQRVYGTAFPTQKDLDEHVTRVEEAKKRDHRVIGKQLGLFTMSPLVGQGLVLWMPKGALVRTELQNLMQGELMKRGYQPVFTPHIGSVEMYKKSGHFPYYKDSQYPTLKAEAKPGETSVEEYLLKPMNCPHHIQIYSAEPRSYRELPVRLAEFGTVYRYEQSGELNGMLRVRGLTQDDAHIFCMDEQVELEIRAMVDLVLYVFGCLGLSDYRVQVSLRDPDSDKYTGDPKNWDKAEDTLRRVAREMNLKHEVARGEAAFYGPKLDFHVKDCIGREWQLGTVQLDYNLPERFELEYVGSDNARHRPVMIHRAPFGSFERFVGVLIEHFAGAFPLWLAPVQVRVANITDKQEEPARRALQALLDAGFRADADLAHGKINAKVAEFEVSKIPYLLVIGEREAQEEKVAVRARGNKNKGVMPLKQFIELASNNVRARSLEEVGFTTAGGHGQV